MSISKFTALKALFDSLATLSILNLALTYLPTFSQHSEIVPFLEKARVFLLAMFCVFGLAAFIVRKACESKEGKIKENHLRALM